MTESPLIQQATTLATIVGADQLTPYQRSCLHQGQEMAELLTTMNVDEPTLAAATIYSCVQYAGLTNEDVAEHLGTKISKLTQRVQQLDWISELYSSNHPQQQQRADNIRRMLLAMVNDIRAVLIKLAERLVTLRACKSLSGALQQQVAQEVSNIYAPLANRLGLWQLKWQLEDLSFRYLQPEKYREISTALKQRRIDRVHYINNFKQRLLAILKNAGIQEIEISGRPKHIYSIHNKMERKKVGIDEIYDALAVRVMVPTITDCYTTLSAVHGTWEFIPSEFDDYIATPKPNGYQSIHTAIIGPEQRNIEIQIRTYNMHQDAELGVAAHWVYKEGPQQDSNYEHKISWLRQIMDWQQELTHTGTESADLFSDRIYVFTPDGEVISMPTGSTPLDFAYHIHSEIGHHCRAAKIDGKIVNLTYQLHTGERVEIVTTKSSHPSRDWLNHELGYLRTSKARAKVHQWFKRQNYAKNIGIGQDMLGRELRRIGIKNLNLTKTANNCGYKTAEELFAALGNNELKLSTIINNITQEHKPEPELLQTITTQPQVEKRLSEIEIYGVDNLLTHLANCCRPIPGDEIVGYITTNRGITIHRHDCPNIANFRHSNSEKIIEVSWGKQITNNYPVNLTVEAYDRHGLIKDITATLNNENITLLGLSCNVDKKENIAYLNLTVEINDVSYLQQLFAKLTQIPNVISAARY